MFLILWLPTLLMLLISGVYFYSASKNSSLTSRIFCSAHGLISALIFLSAYFVAFTLRPSPFFLTPYLILWIVPITSIGISLRRFEGQKRTHLLLFPLLGLMAYGFIIGTIVVSGGK